MRRFFVDDRNITESTILISGADYNHIKNVLRLKPGDNIIVSNGKTGEYEAEIQYIHKKSIEARIIQSYSRQSEPHVEVTLFQGIPKGDKMDMIIQKAVEIGVTRIVPVLTERVVVRLDSEGSRKKTARWLKISEQAAKQSCRNIVPEVTTPISFNNCLEKLRDYKLAVMLYEGEEKTTLRQVLENMENMPDAVAIFVGPEGGFSSTEVDMAADIGKVTLGPRILRTETAGLVSAAIVLYHAGSLG